MTAPRQVLQGVTYLVTRRCLERRFLLRPSKLTNATFEYVLAVAAARHGILLHAYCVLSNHFHLVLTDPDAKLPAFERDLAALVARATNAALGRWAYFWEPGSYSAVALADHRAILEKIVYVLANPVAAGLVRRACDWPGLWSEPGRFGGPPATVERPKGFFRERGPMPPAAQLRLHVPPGFDTAEDGIRAVNGLLREAEDRAAAALGADGRSFAGASRVLSQNPQARPPPDEPRRGLRPRFATRDRWKRLEAVLRLRSFLDGHREAFEAWRSGVRSVRFPAGTYLMRVVHSAPCAAAG